MTGKKCLASLVYWLWLGPLPLSLRWMASNVVSSRVSSRNTVHPRQTAVPLVASSATRHTTITTLAFASRSVKVGWIKRLLYFTLRRALRCELFY